MKRVSVSDLEKNPIPLISAQQTLIIEKDCRTVGFYLPLPKKDRAEAEKAIQNFEQTLNTILSDKGLTREMFEKAWEETSLPH